MSSDAECCLLLIARNPSGNIARRHACLLSLDIHSWPRPQSRYSSFNNGSCSHLKSNILWVSCVISSLQPHLDLPRAGGPRCLPFSPRRHLSVWTCASRALGLLSALLSYMPHAYSTAEERLRPLGVIKILSSVGTRSLSIALSITMYLLNTICCLCPIRLVFKRNTRR